MVIALYRNRLSAAWLVPLLIWGVPERNNGSGSARVHVFLVVVAVLVLALSDWRPRRPRVLERMLRPEAA